MGTPDFAAIILQKLLDNPALEIMAVFTQPDRKSGRGLKESFSAVKELALAHDLPIYQPASLRYPEIASLIGKLHPDFLAVASYGLILPPEILSLSHPLNVHASLLPAFRGAAPIQRAMLENWRPNGKTGVSIMKMEEGLDTGPVYATAETLIGKKTHDELRRELASLGGDLLLKVLLDFENYLPKKQDDSLATYARKLTREDGMLNWNEPAAKLEATVRALQPWPGARTEFELDGGQIAVNIMRVELSPASGPANPGQLKAENDKLLIGCADAWLVIRELRPQGRKSMTGGAFANGYCRMRKGVCGAAINWR